MSSKAGVIDYHNYLDFIHEKCVRALHLQARLQRGGVAGGGGPVPVQQQFASSSTPAARRRPSALGLKAPCYNPYYNNFAQTVEIAHCFDEAQNSSTSCWRWT